MTYPLRASDMRIGSSAQVTPVPSGRILIVDGGGNVSRLWTQHLKDQGFDVTTIANESDAISLLRHQAFNVILLDLAYHRQAVLGLSDYANYRHPDTRLIFINCDSFMSDGLIFRLCSNACAMLPAHSRPSDVAAVVAHHCKR